MLLADFSVFATGAYLSSLNPFLLLLIGDAKLYFPPGVDISGAFLELEGAFFLFLVPGVCLGTLSVLLAFYTSLCLS